MSSIKGNAQRSPFPTRLPPSLRVLLEMQAGRAMRSLNAHIVLLLERSLTEHPILQINDAIEEPLSRVPYGVRMPESIKACLESSAKQGGRPLNTELILRLQLAAKADESASVERSVDEPSYQREVAVAWLRFSLAVDAVLSANTLDLSKAAIELGAAKAAFELVNPIPLAETIIKK